MLVLPARGRKIFSFDVESMGLLGPPFAVGWVVLEDGVETSSGYASIDHRSFPTSVCSPEEYAWLEQNVFPVLPPPVQGSTPKGMYSAFWNAWLDCGRNRSFMLIENGFPVEMNFLRELVNYDRTRLPVGRPLPISDISSVYPIIGVELERTALELPAHNPINDARFTARKWVELNQHILVS